MSEKQNKQSIWDKSIFRSRINSANVKPKEMIFGYLLGPFGGLLTSQVFVVYLNTYWTDILQIGDTEGGYLAAIPLISIVFIVLGNLIAGQMIDRMRTSQGKARPIILISAPFVTLTCILLFSVPTGNHRLQLIWIAVSYNLYYSIAFPLYNTANSITMPLSTRNRKQRGSLSVINSMALLGASSFATLILPMVIPILGVNKEAWLLMICIFGAISLVTILIQYYYTRERITEENMKLGIEEEKPLVTKQIKVVITDKYWWMIILFYFIFLLSGNMQNFSMVYYCNYILGSYQDGYTQTILGVITGIPLAVGMFFSWPLAKRFGKKNLIMAGLSISMVGCFVAFLKPYSWAGVSIGLFIKCLGSAPAIYVMMALFADVLDHIEARFGFRCDGFSMSLRSIIMATALSICQGVFNALLSVTGYLAPSETMGAYVQNAATENVIIWCYIGVMMVGHLLCVLIILPLNVEDEIQEDHQKILERQKKAVLASGGEWIDPAKRLLMEQKQSKLQEMRAEAKKRK